MRFSLLTYNIHKAIGVDRVFDPARIARILEHHDADIVLLQETKAVAEQFPRLEIEDLGYNLAVVGQKTYNGVAILAKAPIEVVETALPGDPADDQARYLEAVVGRPPNHVRRFYASLSYRANSWDKARRVVAKVEWHPGELFPRVGFIATNLSRPAERVVAFYNQRGTAEQHIKEGKNAINWTRVRRAYARPLDGRSRLTLP